MSTSGTRLRSQIWFHDLGDPGGTALHVERYMNFGITREELQSGSPIIGIAQSGSDLSPCNRVHLRLAERVQAGIRAAGGVPLEFPVHPIQETGKRPTAALDRNLAYLGLVEVLHGYPLDGVVLTTGCDKTTPSQLMAAATVNIPAIALSGGPMLDGWYKGQLSGSGTIVWEARKLYAEGEIDFEEFIEMVASSAKSDGHCNTMGTASTMNSLAEALGMSLPGCAAIPAPYKERGQIAYETGRRIVDMVREDVTPSKIMTREAFENVIVANSALGGSTNAPIHVNAIARHIGVPLAIDDWQRLGHRVPLLVNMQPAGEHLGEGFFRAGGLPAVMGELLRAGKLHRDAVTVNGRTIAENYSVAQSADPDVIRPYDDPLKEDAGFVVLKGNLFDAAVMKTSVIDETFRRRYLERPGKENVVEGRPSSSRGRRTITAGSTTRPSRWTRTASSSSAGAGRWVIRARRRWSTCSPPTRSSSGGSASSRPSATAARAVPRGAPRSSTPRPSPRWAAGLRSSRRTTSSGWTSGPAPSTCWCPRRSCGCAASVSRRRTSPTTRHGRRSTGARRAARGRRGLRHRHQVPGREALRSPPIALTADRRQRDGDGRAAAGGTVRWSGWLNSASGSSWSPWCSAAGPSIGTFSRAEAPFAAS